MMNTSVIKTFVLTRVLYAVCAAIIVKTALFGDPRNVRLSYWKFLLMASNGHFYDVLRANNTHNEADLQYIYNLLPSHLQKTRNFTSAPVIAAQI